MKSYENGRRAKGPAAARLGRLLAGLSGLLLSASLPAVEPVMRVHTGAFLHELSGLAAADPATGAGFWAHNDSGDAAILYRLDANGQRRGCIALDAPVLDLEDMAAFRWQQRRWLAVADTGDNFAWRREVAVLLLPEPDAGALSPAGCAALEAPPPGRPANGANAPPPSSAHRLRPRRIVLRYPQGARDVEALAVDAEARQILLLEKRRPPAGLYALALDGPDQQTARLIAQLPDWWPEAPQPVETIGENRYRGAPTAMDLSADGRRLAVLSATHLQIFTRGTGEDWNAVFARAPITHRLPRHPAALQRVIYEAVAWDAQSCVWVGGEHKTPPLLRYCARDD